MQWNCLETWSRVHLKGTHAGEVKIAGVEWRIIESIQDKIETTVGDETQEGIAVGLWSWIHFQGAQERHNIFTEDIIYIHELIGNQCAQEETANDLHSCTKKQEGGKNRIYWCLILWFCGCVRFAGEEQWRRQWIWMGFGEILESILYHQRDTW